MLGNKDSGSVSTGTVVGGDFVDIELLPHKRTKLRSLTKGKEE